MIAVIDQPNDEPAAGASPPVVGLPDVGILIGTGIITETTPPCCDRFIDGILRVSGESSTAHLLRGGIARGKNAQPLIPIQAKFDGDGTAGVDHVQHWRVADGWEQATESEALAHARAASIIQRRYF